MVDVPRPSEPVSDILERLKDPLYLPTRDEVTRAFTFVHDPKYDFGPTTDFRIFLLDVFDGRVYEYPTKEYINGLGDYIASRGQELGITADNPATILEVAAGSGRITHFLNNSLTETHPGLFRTVAIDNFTDFTPSIKRRLGINTAVEHMDYEDALTFYQPTMVIGSWLPATNKRNEREDWTVKFRGSPSVQEYILIGDPERTATSQAFGYKEDFRMYQTPDPFPQYSRDRFTRTDLKFLRPFQFCYRDTNLTMPTSRTFAFSRRK
jgi:hypothetical protein